MAPLLRDAQTPSNQNSTIVYDCIELIKAQKYLMWFSLITNSHFIKHFRFEYSGTFNKTYQHKIF